MLGLIGCNSGGSSSGSSTITTTTIPLTPTQKLVGTWNLIIGVGVSGGTDFHDWRMTNNVLYFTLNSGPNEEFSLTWTGNNRFSMTSLKPDYSTIVWSR